MMSATKTAKAPAVPTINEDEDHSDDGLDGLVAGDEGYEAALASLCETFETELAEDLLASPELMGLAAYQLQLERRWRVFITSADKPVVGAPVCQGYSPFDSVAGYVHWWRLIERSKLLDIVNLDISVFIDGVEPSWEDPHNLRGGRWTLQVTDKVDAVRCTRDLLAALLGATLRQGELALGLVIAPRRAFTRFSVWVGPDCPEAGLRSLGRALLEISHSSKVEFQRHGDGHGTIRHTVYAK